ncbi:hypothetical protein [Argonema antarcticum]|uniref:hypothetical protein n=1 Tax=Argonema antarcticum TaxID=2942763 RepID=UPI002012FED8|nr:hypothetical protein [Argonema antarcticum]MCL1471582.1 hypothetical protein [Argonema antarcticum A004/B2]
MKPKYTINDLTIRPIDRQTIGNGITQHSYMVLFDRSLTKEEQQQFIALILSFDKNVDNNLVAQTNLKFISANQACYAIAQKSIAGDGKDLLFAKLAEFSQEVVAIAQHDGNPVFATKILTTISSHDIYDRI